MKLKHFIFALLTFYVFSGFYLGYLFTRTGVCISLDVLDFSFFPETWSFCITDGERDKLFSLSFIWVFLEHWKGKLATQSEIGKWNGCISKREQLKKDNMGMRYYGGWKWNHQNQTTNLANTTQVSNMLRTYDYYSKIYTYISKVKT
jgi:hypothetical protein